MKKVLFTVALALVAVAASAQEPNFPMMGGAFFFRCNVYNKKRITTLRSFFD